MKDLQNTEESALRDKCSVIRFNDKELGGFEATNDAGENVLAFKRNPRHPGTLELDYVHHDKLPDLSRLKASADLGCAFCAALRNAALGLSWSEPGRATFGLRYSWRPPVRHDGIRMLFAKMRVEFDAFEPSYTETLIFCADCEEGKKINKQPGTLTNPNRGL
jgi:hypothetical protein